jgi:hypothetical protein
MIVGIIVSVDIILNIIWNAAEGFSTETIVPDIYRPALNYVQCHYSDNSIIYMKTHIALKVTLIFAGIVLTIVCRNVPARFK